jgi:hypothetical protein
VTARTGKHGPNRLDRYLAIHDTVMDKYRAQGFILSDDLKVKDLGNGEILMEGTIECTDSVRIEVTKTLRVLDGDGSTATVQTVEHSYSAILTGRGNIFRYCAPHGENDGVPHHPHHHVHRFDAFSGEDGGEIGILKEDAWPTLGEVIEEVRGWCADNAHRLLAQPSGP